MTTTQATTAEKIKCCGCQQMLPIADFGKDSSRKTGRAARCKPCNRTYIKGLGKHEPKPRDPSAVPPRQITTNGTRYSELMGDYYRNDGHKHLKSFGYFC